MAKVVVFGVDGGSLKLVEQWRDELPNLNKIMQNGVYGELESTYPPLTCPAWPCMYTGKNPAKLGIYDFSRYVPDQERMFGINSSLNYSSAIWDILNGYGKRVGLLNLPMTFPPQKIDSFVVCGIGSPDTLKAQYTYPSTLRKTLDEVVGGYEIIPMLLLAVPGKDEQHIRALDNILRKRVRAASYLIAHSDWDLFFCVFQVLDMVQHRFWHHMDENHVKRGNQKYRNIVKDFYIKIDSAIGRLMEEIPSGTNVLIVSDHGFGPAYRQFAVNKWLQHNGFLRLKDRVQERRLNTTLLWTRDFLLSHLSPNLTRIVVRLLPKAIVRKLTVRAQQVDNMTTVYDNIDWSHTKAYGLGPVGMIYINRKGREPKGIVESGPEYEALRDEIITKLRRITNPETGSPVNIQIRKKEDVYHGPYFDSAPDILYVMEKYHQSVSIMEEGEWRQSAISGFHVPEGIFFAWGPDISQGGSKLPGLKIYDIAPTILHMFGLPVPSDMDGRVLTEIFKEDSEPGQKKVTYQEIDHEAERIKRRIRKLKKLKRP